MKNKMIILLFALCMGGNKIFSQATDNAGKDLFSVKNTSSFSFPFSSTGFAISHTGSMNAVDSIKISDSKYNRLKDSKSTRVKYVFDAKANAHFRVINRSNNLTSYYFVGTLANVIFTTPAMVTALAPISAKIDLSTESNLLADLKKQDAGNVIRDILVADLKAKAIDESELSKNNNSDIAGLILQYFKALGISTDKIYHLTDIGNGLSPFFYSLKVSNLAFKSLKNFFTSNNQPTIQLEFGGIINSVLKFGDWEKLKEVNPHNLPKILRVHDFDLFYSLFVNTSCINYLDTTFQQPQLTKTNWQSIIKFAQAGAKVNLNLYWSKVYAGAFTGSIFYGLPLDDDKSFQKGKSKPVTATDTLYTKQGQATGKYGGSINSQTWNGRFSAAFPIFLNKIHHPRKFKEEKENGMSGSVYLLPSYVLFGSLNRIWTHQLGFTINLLSKPYGGKNTSIVQAGGFGFDIQTAHTHTKWGSPIFYVTGNINLGSIIKQPGSAKAAK